MVIDAPPEMKDNLGRCVRCRQVMFGAEYDGHKCIIPDKGVRRIEASQWWESTNAYGEPLLMALGLDGYTYRLTQVRKHGFEELPDNQPSDESGRIQESKSADIPEDLREAVNQFLRSLPPELATRFRHLIGWTV